MDPFEHESRPVDKFTGRRQRLCLLPGRNGGCSDKVGIEYIRRAVGKFVLIADGDK